MTAGGLARWRLTAAALVVASALGGAGVVRWASVRAAHAAAERLAATTAAYLSIVTPAARRGSAQFDLTQLLIQARALAAHPDWTPRFEVYRGTAPLVIATGRPLAPATFDDMRNRETVRWERGAALAPLKDRDDWDVVGAVAIGPEFARSRMGWLDALALAALVAALASGFLAATSLGRAPRLPRPIAAGYAVAAFLLGGAAAAQVRSAARAGDAGWLEQSRVLVEEAARRLPVTGAAPLAATLQRLVSGSVAGGGGAAELAVGAGDALEPGVRFESVAGVARATVAARVGAARWLTLTTTAETPTAWLVLGLAGAALGPLGLWGLAWALRTRERPQRFRETITAWGFLAPATAHLAVFSFAPIVFALYLSVHRWSLVDRAKPFVGLDNFTRLARDPLVWTSLRNTLLYTLHVPVTMAVALGIALILNRHSLVARVARTAFFLPYASSVVAIALVWQWMYHADFGLINYLLRLVGAPPVDWLGNPKTALLAVMIVSIWVQVGYQMVLFLAGLQGIPQTYMDAARVDGASAWRRFWRVTFPLIRPVTLFVLVTGVITSFQAFTSVYVLTDGGPLHATDVIVYRIYQTAWEFLQFGPASALALVLFALLFGVTWAQLKLLGKRVEYA